MLAKKKRRNEETNIIVEPSGNAVVRLKTNTYVVQLDFTVIISTSTREEKKLVANVTHSKSGSRSLVRNHCGLQFIYV